MCRLFLKYRRKEVAKEKGRDGQKEPNEILDLCPALPTGRSGAKHMNKIQQINNPVHWVVGSFTLRANM